MSEYDTDIVAWSERQAALLRRLAAGEQIADQVDWENIIHEIECVGHRELIAVGSGLRQALTCMLKVEGWPSLRDAPAWRADAVDFRRQAKRRFAPSMRQHIDLEKIYRRALGVVPSAIDGQPPRPLPQTCQVTLDELLLTEP